MHELLVRESDAHAAVPPHNTRQLARRELTRLHVRNGRGLNGFVQLTDVGVVAVAAPPTPLSKHVRGRGEVDRGALLRTHGNGQRLKAHDDERDRVPFDFALVAEHYEDLHQWFSVLAGIIAVVSSMRKHLYRIRASH